MLKDNKLLIYGGGLFAGAAIVTSIIASEDGFCLDSRVMCGPLPAHMADLPSGEDGPQPLQTINLPYVAVSSISSVASISHLWRVV
jgi:hypothetical protein